MRMKKLSNYALQVEMLLMTNGAWSAIGGILSRKVGDGDA